MAMYQVQMVNNVKTLVPVSGDVSTDSVTDNDMHPVTSNAVADSLSYSTTETLTGGTWIDGKPIYRKVIKGLSFGGTTSVWTNTGATISNVATLIKVFAIKTSEGPVEFMNFTMNGSNLQYVTYHAWSGVNVVIAEYTKTT